MGQPVRLLLRDAAGVSPVVGTVLVLAISVLGIAGILAWGAPTIDRIQTRNAQAAMEGEFEGLRDASQELSVPDHSRFPTVAVPGGSLAVQPGTRFLVTADRDSANPACDVHVTDWADGGTDKDKVTVTATGCRTPTLACTPLPLAATSACLEIYSVSGTTTIRQTVVANGGYQVVGADFSKGDWMFRLADGATTNPVVYAEAWLHSTDQVAWTLQASTGMRSLFLDGGAVFSQSGGTYFLEKEASIGDSSFGSGYYGLWLRSLLAGTYSAIDGAGSRQVFLSLLGNSVRIDSTSVTKLRFDLSGTLAQSWCNALLARNPHLVTGSPAQFFGVYTSQAASCGAIPGVASGVRSVCFAEFAPATTAPTDACTPSGLSGVTLAPFQLRFLHARIDVSLSV